MRAVRSLLAGGAVTALGIAIATGCEGPVLKAAPETHIPPGKANVLLHLDMPEGYRKVGTVPAAATDATVVIRDNHGYIAGGFTYRDIPSNRTIAIPGLPANINLKFLIVLYDVSGKEVAVTKKQQSLPSGQTVSLSLPVYMNAGDLSGSTLASTVFESTSGTLSLRLMLSNGLFFAILPSVSAVNSLNQPVTCNPTFQIRTGMEGNEDMGEASTSAVAFAVVGTGNTATRDVQVVFVENCGASAATITRRVTVERTASGSFTID